MVRARLESFINDVWTEVRPWVTNLFADFVILLIIMAFFVLGQILIHIASIILNSIGYTEPLRYVFTIETLFKAATVYNVVLYIIIQCIRKLPMLQPLYDIINNLKNYIKKRPI
jgi:hypothetical protein